MDQFLSIMSSLQKDLQDAMNGLAAEKQLAATHEGETANQSGLSQAVLPNAAVPEKQTQPMRPAQNRAGAKAGQAPAAPTTSQPPFAIGAQQSPKGEPTYFGKPAVTQSTLNPPPPRKKARVGAPPASSPAVANASGPSPQPKAPSPEVRRQQAPAPAPSPAAQGQEPAKPQAKIFACPDPACDMHITGFQSEGARDTHYRDEHVKPYEDPRKFFEENLSAVLGVDYDGTPKTAIKHSVQEAGSASAPAMHTSLSKQGQTPSSKPDLAATPMSRDASMRRQGSAAGGKGLDNNGGTPGGNGPQSTPKLGDGKLETPQPPALEDPWAGSTIDPQSLFAGFAPLDFATGNMLPEFAYRSTTPNDTPESSKDSGASEPNSDISESMNLEIDMSWQPMDGDILYDVSNVDMEEFGQMESDYMTQFLVEDMTNDFSKPFTFDPSLYSMDPT